MWIIGCEAPPLELYVKASKCEQEENVEYKADKIGKNWNYVQNDREKRNKNH